MIYHLLNFLRVCTYVASLVTVACTTSKLSQINHHPEVWEDSSYHEILEKNTRSAEVISSFETHYVVHATLVNGPFLQAFAERYRSLYIKDAPIFEAGTNKTIFVVSIFSPNGDLLQLDNRNLWSIFLQHQNDSNPASVIRKLVEKDRWTPFFERISPWSEEYLVVFDLPLPPSVSGSPTVEPDSIELILSNAQAKVRMTW